MAPRSLPEKPFIVLRMYLIVVPRPFPAAPLAVRRTHLAVLPRLVPRLLPTATRHLHRGKVTPDFKPLSDAGSAGKEGRPFVMRIGY
jgi:hypothetical protein